MHRRELLFAGVTLAFARVGRAQSDHGAHGDQYESLAKLGRIPLPTVAQTQRSIESAAPKAANAGRWLTRAALSLPRSEMAWATQHADRMHILGGVIHQPAHHARNVLSTTSRKVRSSRRISRFSCANAKFARPSGSVLSRARYAS